MSSVHTPNEGRQWRYLAYRMTNFLTDCTTAVSQDAIDTATRRGAAPRDGIRLIGNGIDTDEFRPDPAIRERVRSELGVGDAFTWPIAAGIGLIIAGVLLVEFGSRQTAADEP